MEGTKFPKKAQRVIDAATKAGLVVEVSNDLRHVMGVEIRRHQLPEGEQRSVLTNIDELESIYCVFAKPTGAFLACKFRSGYAETRIVKGWMMFWIELNHMARRPVAAGFSPSEGVE